MKAFVYRGFHLTWMRCGGGAVGAVKYLYLFLL